MSTSQSIEPVLVRNHPVGNGTQKLFRFPNGYGASVVQFRLGHGLGFGSYTSNDDEWELAVIIFSGEANDVFELTYSTPITNDVIGHLTEKELQKTLCEIRDLPPQPPSHE